MSLQKTNNFKPKKSKLRLSPEMLQSLKNIYINSVGTISYVFVTIRVKFTKEYPEGILFESKSFLNTKINSDIFFDEIKGKKIRRTPEQVIQIFEDTKHDLGADYYILG